LNFFVFRYTHIFFYNDYVLSPFMNCRIWVLLSRWVRERSNTQ